MSWEDQGRQYHEWFGHGTASDKSRNATPDPSVTGKSIEDRVLALAYGAIAALPATLRGRAEAQYHNGNLSRLKEAMTTWFRGIQLDRATFAARFFGRRADDPVVYDLHNAVLGAATATSQKELREAATKVADAIKKVGVDQWPRFVADVAERARNPATLAALRKSLDAASPAPTEATTGTTPGSRRGLIDDLERRRQIALSFIRPGGSATLTDTKAVIERLALMMTFAQLQKMKSADIHIIVSRNSVTDYLANLRGVQPRGYPPGLTWDTVPGTVAGNNEVVIATHTGANGERELPDTRQSSSADVTLHEIGHAINRQARSDWASERKNFKQAYDKDAGKGPLADSYYHQYDTAAGRDEAFAESHAEFLTDPAAMKARYPNLYSYWERYYEAGK